MSLWLTPYHVVFVSILTLSHTRLLPHLCVILLPPLLSPTIYLKQRADFITQCAFGPGRAHCYLSVTCVYMEGECGDWVRSENFAGY